MPRTPLQTLLEERLQSARGLGWDMRDFPCIEGESQAGTGEAGKAPAWFRFAYLALRSLGFARG